MMLFRKKRYEVGIIDSHENYYKSKLEKAQDNGWEIAGLISTRRDLQNHSTYITIPMKRLVKKSRS